MVKDLKGLFFTISSIVIGILIWLTVIGLDLLLNRTGERYLGFVFKSIPLTSLSLAALGLVFSFIALASKQTTKIVKILSLLSIFLAIVIILVLFPIIFATLVGIFI